MVFLHLTIRLFSSLLKVRRHFIACINDDIVIGLCPKLVNFFDTNFVDKFRWHVLLSKLTLDDSYLVDSNFAYCYFADKFHIQAFLSPISIYLYISQQGRLSRAILLTAVVSNCRFVDGSFVGINFVDNNYYKTLLSKLTFVDKNYCHTLL